MADQVIVTGGEATPSKVSVYNADFGFLEDLPTLKNGRYYHACGHYIDTNDKLVSLLRISRKEVVDIYAT